MKIIFLSYENIKYQEILFMNVNNFVRCGTLELQHHKNSSSYSESRHEPLNVETSALTTRPVPIKIVK